jgi:hypothetical protein
MQRVEIIKDDNRFYLISAAGVESFEGNWDNEMPWSLEKRINEIFGAKDDEEAD